MGLTIGAERVLMDYGSPLAVAEAVIEGRMSGYDQKFVWEIVPRTSPIWEAAKIRIELRARLAIYVEVAEVVAEALASDPAKAVIASRAIAQLGEGKNPA